MRFTFLLFFIFNFIHNPAQEINIYYEQLKDKINIYADNPEFSPISVKMDFKLENLNMKGRNSQIFVVDALQENQLLTTLNVIETKKSYQFSYSAISNYGNHLQSDYDNEYEYDLPFKKGKSFKIDQGYFGKFSHQNEHSLDFNMPIGTEVTSVRDGIVIRVIDHNSGNCARRECEKFNNLILIYHSDGTFAEYSHLKQNSSKVKVGEKIKKGQIIGLSGDVGFVTGPHLHLVIFLQKLLERETIPTKFKVENGNKSVLLEEHKVYFKNY